MICRDCQRESLTSHTTSSSEVGSDLDPVSHRIFLSDTSCSELAVRFYLVHAARSDDAGVTRDGKNREAVRHLMILQTFELFLDGVLVSLASR